MYGDMRPAWRTCLYVAGLVAAMAGVGATARAQDIEPPVQRTWSIKLGAFLPTQSDMQSQSSDVWWYGGVDYHPNFRYKPANGEVYFGADFEWRQSEQLGYFVIPMTAKIVWNITPAESRHRVYGGVGAGVYFINTGYNSGTTQAGLRFIAGVELSDRLFCEVNYDWVNPFTDNRGTSLRADGVTALLGYRL